MEWELIVLGVKGTECAVEMVPTQGPGNADQRPPDLNPLTLTNCALRTG